MQGTKRKGVSALVGTLVVIIILLAGIAAYAFVNPPSGTTVTKTVQASPAGAISTLKVGLILPITQADHSWNYQAQEELQKLQKQYGFSLNVTENKFDGTSAQPIAEQYASQGVNVLFLQGIQYMVMANTIAPKYPKTLFVCVDCFAANYSNVYRVWLDPSGAGFVLGTMAGMLTKTNTMGLIGGGRVSSIWSEHEGFKAGALYTNPAVKFTEKYEAFSWADSAGAQKDATNMYTNGADIVFSSGDGIDVGVIGAALASSASVWAANQYSNLSAIDSSVNKILLGSAVVSWSTLFNKALVDYVSNNWAWGFVTANMQSGIIQVQPGPNLSSTVSKAGLQVQSMIVQGAITMYFKTNPTTGNPFCFDKPTDPSCADTSLSTAAAQFNFLPPASSLP